MPATRTPQDRKPAASQAAAPAPAEQLEELEADAAVEQIQMTVPDGVDDDGEAKTRTVPGMRATVRGITVEIPDEALDDFELLDDLRAAQDDEDGSRLPSLLRRLVGADYRRVMDELRDPVTKRVTVEAGARFVWDLFKALNPNS